MSAIGTQNLFKTLMNVVFFRRPEVFLLLFSSGLLSGCSMEASLTEAISKGKDLIPIFKQQREVPDFTSGEVVSTVNGVVVTGVFGEISEKIKLDNEVIIEGAFYGVE